MDSKFTVEVTQFMMPDGRSKVITFDLPKKYEPKYQAMKDDGCRLEAEVLSDYRTVSFTVTSADADEDVELVENGPGTVNAVCRLLERGAWKNESQSA